MTDDTKQFVKDEIQKSAMDICKEHFGKWNVTYLKYLAMLSTGMAAIIVDFFHGTAFLWTDWASFGGKVLAVFGSVTTAFIDSTYTDTKKGAAPIPPQEPPK
jgi:hypothetical protein